MGVSEMQIAARVRPVIAEMEKGLFKVVDELQKETLAIDKAAVEAGFKESQRQVLGQFTSLKYYRDDDPELRGLPKGNRNMERATLNKGIREVLRVINYVRAHPGITEEQLVKLRRPVFPNFPPNVDIRAIPTLIAWGDVFAMLSRVQKDAKFDLDEEEDALDAAPLNPRQPRPEEDEMLPVNGPRA